MTIKSETVHTVRNVIGMMADKEMEKIAEELRITLAHLSNAYGITKKQYEFKKNRGPIDYIRCVLNPEKHAIVKRPFEGNWSEFTDFKIGYKIMSFDKQTCIGFSQYIVLYEDIEVLRLNIGWGITFEHASIETFRKDINWYSKLIIIYNDHLTRLQAVEDVKMAKVKELRQAMQVPEMR